MDKPRDAALIVGINGGIGSALARKWRNEHSYDRVLGSCRDPASAGIADADCLPLDLRDASAIAGFAERLRAALGNDTLRTICICSGMLHGTDVQPERRMADTAPEALRRLLDVNAVGPLLLLTQLSKLLPRRETSRILVLSARVGSIADNRLGGWVSYRASKAALNQGVQTLAIEMQRTHPGCVITLYHPGTVATALSAPFQKNVPEKQLFSAEHAAHCLDQVLHSRHERRTHLFVDWANQEVAF